MATTLDELKTALVALGDLAKAHELINALADLGLITPQEELVIKTRLRAKLRIAVDEIPREEG